ncbi:phosphodiester glycosidase family protein [Nocardioides houyundeii]|uniref:phosphodiester glycosidase family protein n=1 Tax=Nocardioides houyundeii TaxID=2045452 RepID=UPI000C77316F|nr:phosphodiester glycosidase family protein [Nocardioides houyundeii]
MPSSTRLTPSARKTVTGTIVAVLSAGVALASTASPTASATPPSPDLTPTVEPAAEPTAPRRAPGTGTADAPRHASDGVAGWVAREQPSARVASMRRKEIGWNMAPGIDYRSWDQVDGIRKPIRAHLVTVDIVNPANSFDLISTAKVAATSKMSWMTEKAKAVAAVNGDFFDISDTGAPLGVGRNRKSGLRHAPASGWNSAFWVDKAGRPHVGELPWIGSFVKKHPKIKFTNFNSPTVEKHGVGVYTPAWGKTKGKSVVDGQKKVRSVIIKNGRVVSNKYGVTSGKKVQGKLLIGRGRSVKLLKGLKKGERLKLTWRVKGAPKMAIGGDRPLVLNGQRVVINDQLMHPRTAVGIDEDANKVLLLTIDGRQAHSRGYTMVELANMMIALGAENALNLDGGGSTTLVGHTDAGQLSVLNLPSDGGERYVPNGLGVFSDPIS